MNTRIFDRRGRQNWDPEKREAEDRRMRERRSSEDRRVQQRRQRQPWPDGSDQINQRVAERRLSGRRASTATPDGLPSTDERRRTARTVPEIRAGASLREAISLLATRNVAVLVALDDNHERIGLLSERQVVHAIARHGEAALSQPVSAFLTGFVVS